MNAIVTTHKGPTDTKGSKIVATDNDGNRKAYSYNSRYNPEDNHMRAAERFCESLGLKGSFITAQLKPNSRVHVLVSESYSVGQENAEDADGIATFAVNTGDFYKQHFGNVSRYTQSDRRIAYLVEALDDFTGSLEFQRYYDGRKLSAYPLATLRKAAKIVEEHYTTK